MCPPALAGLLLGLLIFSGVAYLLVRSRVAQQHQPPVPGPALQATTSGAVLATQRPVAKLRNIVERDRQLDRSLSTTLPYVRVPGSSAVTNKGKGTRRNGLCSPRPASSTSTSGSSSSSTSSTASTTAARDLTYLILLVCGATTAGGSSVIHTHTNITYLLNNLLLGYDNRLRPDYGGPATVVKADMNIRSMGPISEVDMSYSMDAYFRQTWSDKRLQFHGPIEEMAVHIKMLERIWTPDTYFYNGRGSYLHTTTTPNKLLRIKQDGTVLYSMRLTIKASCPMYLHYFPVDEQLCPLQFGSYAYTDGELLYIWKHGNNRSIKISNDMRMSQFDLTGHPTSDNMTVRNRSGEFSTLAVSFRLQRHMGYFMIQVYVPCTLIVILSWVSFWINREATADRVGLGITTVLTLTTVSLDSRDDLPKVSYATALDWFILMCYGFVIASLLEYAGVHYFTKIGSGEFRHESDSEGEDRESLERDDDVYYNQVQHTANERYFMNNYNHMSPVICQINNRQPVQPVGRVSPPAAAHSTDSCLVKFFRCIQGNSSYRKLMMKSSQVSGVNSVSMIDKVSRVLFPVAFTGLSVTYWIAYTR